MKITLKHVVVLTALTLVGMVQNAQAQTAQFGMSGCGVGSLIFDRPEDYEVKWKQIVGAVVESYLGVQSSAITSGTSNCRYTAARTADARDVFIDINGATIAQDAARGGGETIDTLATMTGCSSAKTLGTELRNNYPELFVRELSKDEKMSVRVREFMKSNPKLAKSCTNLG